MFCCSRAGQIWSSELAGRDMVLWTAHSLELQALSSYLAVDVQCMLWSIVLYHAQLLREAVCPIATGCFAASCQLSGLVKAEANGFFLIHDLSHEKDGPAQRQHMVMRQVSWILAEHGVDNGL